MELIGEGYYYTLYNKNLEEERSRVARYKFELGEDIHSFLGQSTSRTSSLSQLNCTATLKYTEGKYSELKVKKRYSTFDTI